MKGGRVRENKGQNMRGVVRGGMRGSMGGVLMATIDHALMMN